MAVKGTNSLHFATVLDNSGLKKGTLDGVAMIQSMRSQIARINPFVGLAVAASTAFIAISRSAYKLSKEFQHAMKEVETISKATQENFKGISAEVFKLSNISPDSPVKLAKAYYQIVSAGYDGAKGLKLLEVASKSATAGVTDTMTAADGITTVLNAFKIGAEDSEKVADILFQTVKLGKTTFGELASNLSTVAPLAAANEISFEQISAAVATLTKQGVPTAQAMTQIRSAIIAANEVLEDGWSKSMSLQEAFQMIYNSANGSQSALREMLGRVEAVSGVLGVSGQNAKMAAEDLQSYADATGAMKEANSRMLTSDTNQWELFGNKVKAKMHGIGEAILESSSFIAEGLNGMMTEAEDLTGQAVKAAVEFDNLRAELEDANTEFERKKEILAQLKSEYPDYLSSLDLDKIKEDNLTSTLRNVAVELDKINGLMQERIRLAGYQEIFAEEEKVAIKAQKEVIEQENIAKNAFLKIQQWAKKRKIPLEFNLLDFKEGEFFKIRNAISKQLAGKNTSEITAQLNALADAAGKLEKGELLGKSLYEQAAVANNAAASAKQSLEAAKLQGRNFEQWTKAVNSTRSIEELNSVTKAFSENAQLTKTENEKLNVQITKRKGIVAQLQAISKIEKTNASELAKYEKSKNEEIQRAAQAKRVSFKTVGFKTDSDKTFKDSLREKQEEYEKYERLKAHSGEEYAQSQYTQLLKEGQDYREFLLQKLEAFKGHKEEEAAILEAAEKSKFRGFKQEKKVSAIEVPNSLPVQVELTPPDEENVNEIEARIRALEAQFKKARNKSDKERIAKKINTEKEKLNVILGVLNQEKGAYEDLYNSINDLTLGQLRTRKRALASELSEIRKKLAEELSREKKNASEIAKLQKQEERAEEDLQATTEASTSKAQGKVQQYSQAVKELGELFEMFGDEETGKILGQLAGVGEGVAQMMTGNPADIISGAIKVAKSALTVEVVSDTAKFEAAIEKLEKAIENLDYVISKSVGNDRIKSRLDGINQVKDLEKAANDAYKAEQAARKEVKLLGIRVGKKGKGSGTDPAKLEEFKQKAEEARRKVEKLKEEIKELWVGTSKEGIVDNILDDLEKAKGKLTDFKEFSKKTFDEIVRESIMKQFKRNAIEKWVQGFVDEFAKLSDNEGTTTKTRIEEGRTRFGVKTTEDKVIKTTSIGDGEYDLTEDEIKTLRNRYAEGMGNIAKKYELIQEMLRSVGAFDEAEKAKKGIEGEISRKITEETGTLIAGIARAKLTAIKEGVSVARLQLGKLNEIAKNTSYNKHLETIASKIKNIEKHLS